jgi:ribosomal protein L19
MAKFSKQQILVCDIYIDAVETFMIQILKEITYANVRKISEIIDSFKPGDTVRKRGQTRKDSGKVISKAFNNALIKIIKSGVSQKDG